NESDARIQQPMRKVVYGLEQLVQCDQAQHRKVMLLSGKPRYHAEYVMSDDWRDAEKQQRNNGEEQEASASLLPAYDGGADADAGRRHRASRPARATCDESGVRVQRAAQDRVRRARRRSTPSPLRHRARESPPPLGATLVRRTPTRL